MLRMVGSCSFLATVFRCCLHSLLIHWDCGNLWYFVKYVFSMAVVSCVNLKVLDVCRLYPLAVRIPFSKSMSFGSTWLSS